MLHEVIITNHWSKETYNVDLVSWDRRGNGVSHGRAFNVSQKEAQKVAEKQADIYGAKITDKTKEG